MTRKSRGKSAAAIVERAREFRQGETTAEQILWEALRARRLAGLKFRRQHPYEHLILDFFCVEKLCAVELDGGVHNVPEQREHDRARDVFLAERGIRVIRTRNEDVLCDLPATVARLLTLIDGLKDEESPLS